MSDEEKARSVHDSFFKTSDGSCIFKHGTVDEPIDMLFGVRMQPIENLPAHCGCGAEFIYAKSIAFINISCGEHGREDCPACHPHLTEEARSEVAPGQSAIFVNKIQVL